MGEADRSTLGGMGSNLRPAEMAAVLGDDRLKGAIVANTRSNDPAKAGAAFSFLDQQYRANPVQFQAKFGNVVIQNLRAWQSNIATQTPEGAVAALQKASDPDEIESRERLTKAADENLKSVSPADEVGKFCNPPSWAGALMAGGLASLASRVAAPAAPVTDTPGLTAQVLRADYAKAYQDAFVRTGDTDEADKTATDLLQLKWGASQVNGNRIMAYPPERYYPQVRGSFDWINDQLTDKLKGLTGWKAPPDPMLDPELGPDPFAHAFDTPKQGEADNIANGTRSLMPDKETEAEIAAGKPPGYQVVVLGARDGRFHAVMGTDGKLFRFHGDVSIPSGIAERDFTGPRQRARDTFTSPEFGVGAFPTGPM